MYYLTIHRRIHNLNRLLIVSLTLTGLLMNGYQDSDWVFALSVWIWIWLPEWDRNLTEVFDYLFTHIKTDENKKH